MAGPVMYRPQRIQAGPGARWLQAPGPVPRNSIELPAVQREAFRSAGGARIPPVAPGGLLMQFSLPVRGVAVGLALALAASASPSEAQTGRGFLFDEPNVILGARGGFGVASAGSDLFDFVRQELTL